MARKKEMEFIVKQFRSSGGTSVFSLFLNLDSDEADVTSLGRLFHTFAPLTGTKLHRLGTHRCKQLAHDSNAVIITPPGYAPSESGSSRSTNTPAIMLLFFLLLLLGITILKRFHQDLRSL